MKKKVEIGVDLKTLSLQCSYCDVIDSFPDDMLVSKANLIIYEEILRDMKDL